jgi:CDP-diacylglycerol--glycerol-3-phosphate 3-phosphatidyltransferase/cardiolipin synthase
MLAHWPNWTVPREWSARDLARVPGLLSLTRLSLAGVFPFVVSSPSWSIAAVLVAGATDVLDGWYARRFHQESATGAFVDAVADKVFVLSVAVTMLCSGLLSLAELAALGTRDLGEVLLGLRLAARGRPVLGHRPNAGGKIATLCQFVAVVGVLGGAPFRTGLIGVAAIAGALAVVSYWQRDGEVSAVRS